MSKEHNVFISWSGPRSFTVAAFLREWLPTIIQVANPWMSDTDIEKGSPSLSAITTALTGAKFGIVCLTPENQTTPWLLFEAGALSNAIAEGSKHVCTYLLGGLSNSDLKQPLGMFQSTLAQKEDTRKLVHTLNKVVSDPVIPSDRLNNIFDKLWPDLDKVIATLSEPLSEMKPKRDLYDMVSEILELARGEAQRSDAYGAGKYGTGNYGGSSFMSILAGEDASSDTVQLKDIAGGFERLRQRKIKNAMRHVDSQPIGEKEKTD